MQRAEPENILEDLGKGEKKAASANNYALKV